MVNHRRDWSSFPLVLAFVATSLSVLVGCPGSMGVEPVYNEAAFITLANDGPREIVVAVANTAPGTVVDLAVLEGNPDYVFDEAFADEAQTTVTIAPGATTSIPRPIAPTAVLS